MALDFRDNLFQDDPFRGMKAEASPSSSVLHVYEHFLVMNEWHMDLPGRGCNSTLAKKNALENKMIINAGGIVGSPRAFPQLTWAVLEASGEQCDDQVALNLAVHGKLFNATAIVHSHTQGEGSINNVGWGGGKVLRYDSRKRFLNSNCFPSPVVHQYDAMNLV